MEAAIGVDRLMKMRLLAEGPLDRLAGASARHGEYSGLLEVDALDVVSHLGEWLHRPGRWPGRRITTGNHGYEYHDGKCACHDGLRRSLALGSSLRIRHPNREREVEIALIDVCRRVPGRDVQRHHEAFLICQ